MKREVALAVAVGALGGLWGAYSSRSKLAVPPTVASPPAAAVDSDSAPHRVAAGPREKRASSGLSPILRVQVRPAKAVALRLSRWSPGAGGAANGSWYALPDGRTAPDGSAELRLPAGTYWVAAQSAWAQVDVTEVSDVELELGNEGPLSGTVEEEGTGRPISGALVVAAHGDSPPETEKQSETSDGLGRFAFDALPKGSVRLEASVPGWLPTVEEVQVPSVFTLRLKRACRVDGVVVDGEGSSVSAAGVAAPSTLAGEGGRFWLDLDCEGATLWARDARGRVASAKVETGQRSVTLKLQAGHSIVGSVRGPDGQPAVGAEISASLASDDTRARTVSDERGEFTLSSLAPGNYVLLARKGRGSKGAVYGHGVPGGGRAELTLAPSAALEGTVSGADDPIAVELSWSRLRGERAARTTTSGGRFRFDDVPPGAAYLHARARGARVDTEVFLTEGQTLVSHLTLERVGRIVGRANHVPAQGLTVVALRDGDFKNSPSARVESDGTFIIEAPEGEYRMAVAGDSSFLTVRSQVVVKAGQDTRADVEVAVDGGSRFGAMASVARGELGASYENINGAVQLSWVVADSPISAAGLRVGDVVVAVDGRPVADALDAFSRTRGQPGERVELTWRREGVERRSQVTLAP